MRNAPHTPGVPTPYHMHVHPWPTRFHGPIYTRPVFGFPVIARPEQVFTPGYDLSRGAPQPPISGLGAVNSAWDTGDGVFKPGGYGGGVFDNNISGLGSLGVSSRAEVAVLKRARRGLRGLGDDSTDYPWKTVSEKTRALQKATNEALAKAGMCPITVDGKLGGGTCGARNFLTANSEKLLGQEMHFANPSACEAHASELKRPTAKADGCGGSSGGGGGLTTLPANTSAALPGYSESGMSSSTKRTLGFALGGLLAIGAVVMMRRKR